MHNKPIIKLFNEIAPRYDFLNHVFSFNLDRYWRAIALRTIASHPGAVILDLCTGTADIAIAAATHHNRSHVYGIDLSGDMLAMAKTKISQRHLEKSIQLLQADAIQLPFSDGGIDAIFLSFGLRNIQNRARGIEEMRRVLKEDGHVVILEFSPPQHSLLGIFYHI